MPPEHTAQIDSHHHFWKLDRGDYHWITDDISTLKRDYLPEHLAPQLAAAGVEKTVLVQAAETDEETDFILSLAKQHDFIAGVVGWVDMEQPNATDKLKRLESNSQLLGIRPVMQDIEDTQWMLQPCLDSSFQWIIDNNKTFDALIKPRHLNTLLTLLARYPEMPVVIDHGAKPDIANNQFQPWADEIAAIAANSNAYCKLSGLVTEAGENVSFQALEPYMTHLLNCFGADRLMWGSDWPVINLACDYNQWVQISQEFIGGLADNQQAAILGGTAEKFYRI